MTAVQTNARYQGTKQCGNTEKFFDDWKKIISLNDGKRECGCIVDNCFSQAVPFNFSVKTDVNITMPNWDVNNIRKGFMTANLRCGISIEGLDATPGAWNDTDNLAKLFIGYKASCQAIREMSLWHDSVQTKYHTQYITQEGFTFGAFRPWSARDKKRFVHTLYENARRFMPDICGVYVNIKDYVGGATQYVDIPLNIPIVDFLGLQCFDKWLSDFGQLFLELYFSEHSLVVATCDPKEVLDNKVFLQTDNVVTTVLAGDFNKYEHRFTQIEDEFTSFGKVAYNAPGDNAQTTRFTAAKIRVRPSNCSVTYLTSTIRGYKITDSAKKAIVAKCLSEHLIIPAQQLIYNIFPAPPGPGGVRTTIQVPYQNITAACVVFPKTDHQITCFENPMLQDLQIDVGGDFIPRVAYETTGPRFLQEQLILTDLDGNLQATREFTESIVNSRNNPLTGARYLNSLGDDTSFISIFSTERADGGYVFDGKTTEGNVSTNLKGVPIYTGTNDTYYYPHVNLDNSVDLNTHPPAPQLWLCQDTFFVYDGKGFHYINNASPHGSQTEGRP